jgi:hypothetical protein
VHTCAALKAVQEQVNYCIEADRGEDMDATLSKDTRLCCILIARLLPTRRHKSQQICYITVTKSRQNYTGH